MAGRRSRRLQRSAALAADHRPVVAPYLRLDRRTSPTPTETRGRRGPRLRHPRPARRPVRLGRGDGRDRPHLRPDARHGGDRLAQRRPAARRPNRHRRAVLRTEGVGAALKGKGLPLVRQGDRGPAAPTAARHREQGGSRGGRARSRHRPCALEEDRRRRRRAAGCQPIRRRRASVLPAKRERRLLRPEDGGGAVVGARPGADASGL